MSTPNPTKSVDVVAEAAEVVASTTTPSVDEEIDQVPRVPAASDTPDQVAKKRQKRKTSSVWEDVTEILEKGVRIVICNHCNAKFAISKGAPTTTYKRHIDNCTVRQAKISGKGKGSGGVQSILSQGSIGSGSLLPYKYDKEAVKDMIAKMILVHEYPFMMVEHKLFVTLCKMLNPKHEPCGRAVIKGRAMDLYVQEKAKMKEMFAHVGRISLTSDLWTSNQTKGYMCITGHFLDEEWKLQNRILNFCLLPPPHTGVAIANKMFECLCEWGIEDKISTVTLDNASSNDAAIRALKEQFEGRGVLYFNGKIFHIRCCAHILNLLVQDGLIPLKSAIEKIRESVKYITLSPSRLHKWGEVVKNMSLPTNQSLILDCVTRWNSKFHMLERALIFKDAFARYASRDSSLPSDKDWEVARDICKFLSIFDKVTQIFSGREYTTANLYFNEIWKIRQILDGMANDPRDFIRLMVQKMKDKFDKYWNECSLFMIVAAVLDPRNKLKYIKYAFTQLYGEEEAQKKIDHILDELHMLYEDYVAKERSGGSADFVHATNASGNVDHVDSGRVEFEDWVKINDDPMPTRKELDVYLEERVLLGCGTKDWEVLGWWKKTWGRTQSYQRWLETFYRFR